MNIAFLWWSYEMLRANLELTMEVTKANQYNFWFSIGKYKKEKKKSGFLSMNLIITIACQYIVSIYYIKRTSIKWIRWRFWVLLYEVDWGVQIGLTLCGLVSAEVLIPLVLDARNGLMYFLSNLANVVLHPNFQIDTKM